MTASTRSDVRAMIGTVLNGSSASYHLQDLIGEGGQGWVFRASYDDADGYPVVVKVLRPDAATKDAMDRFRREAAILQRLSAHNPSPFIVRYFDHGEASFPLPEATIAGDRAVLPYTVLEYVHGEALSAVLDRQRGNGLVIGRARRIAREIAKALELVHSQGIVHRDLKPSNILLASEAGREVTKVTDFGLVKLVELSHTSTGGLAGVSLSYAPPEQYEPGNARVGPPTDIFSFATIIFEILCGNEAFPANKANPFEALRLIATCKRPKLAERVPSLPIGLRERADLIARLDVVLEGALAAEPHDRPQTLDAFWDALDPILREADGKGPTDISGRLAAAATVPAASLANIVSQPQPQPSAPTPSAATPGRGLPTMRGNAATSPSLGDASDPRAWNYRVIRAGTSGVHVRDVCFEGDAQPPSFVAALSNGLLRHDATGLSSIPIAPGMIASEVRAISQLPNGSLICAGERGLVAFLHGGAVWDVRRLDDHDVTFHAIASEPSGQVILAVGERQGHAIAVELTNVGIRRTFELADLPPLRALAYLDGEVAFACGDGGGLLRFDGQGLTRLAWERTGHLRAIVTVPGATARAFAVGTGGHALSILAKTGVVAIEKVMTTQDLLGLALAPDGALWAVSANARIVRRDTQGSWRRVSGELPFPGHLVRVRAGENRVIVIGEDGGVLEGVLGGS